MSVNVFDKHLTLTMLYRIINNTALNDLMTIVFYMMVPMSFCVRYCIHEDKHTLNVILQ